jgi:predicted alpha/beta hydrolase family esterase
MKRDILIIPGFGENSTMGPYKKLKKLLESKPGITVRFYNPQWNYRTTTDWLIDFERKITITDETSIIGFSMGAYLALLIAQSHLVDQLILASLSPFFKENIPRLPSAAHRFFGKRKMADFKNYSIPKKIKANQAIFLFGDKDMAMAIKQAQKLARQYQGNFHLIQNTPHDLTDTYIQVIVGIL